MVFSQVVGLVLGMVGFRFGNRMPVAPDIVYIDVDAFQIVVIAGFEYRWDVLFSKVS